mgnify:CR=1 FL=1
MTLIHEYKCDQCGVRKEPVQVMRLPTAYQQLHQQLPPLYPPTPSDPYGLPPEGWQVAAGKHFCGWPCVERYASKQDSPEDEAQPKRYTYRETPA